MRPRPASMARVRFPTPSGPLNSSAGGNRPRDSARASRPFTRSWPMTLGNGMLSDEAALFPPPGPPLRPGIRRALAVYAHPASGVGLGHLEIARAHAVVELADLGLQAVERAARAGP